MAIIRCAMFDFGHIIGLFDTIRWYSFIRENRGNCLEPHEAFSGSRKIILQQFDLGQIGELDYFRIYKEAYQLRDVSMDQFFYMFGIILRIDWGMLRIINKLRQRGIVTILVTNMNSYHACYIRQNYPEVMVSFDYKMISCEEGVAKPDPEALIRPLEWTGLKAEEVIFIDDCYSNIKAACQLGIRGWHYNVTDSHFCPNGQLEEERSKFKNFLAVLDGSGFLYDCPRTLK